MKSNTERQQKVLDNINLVHFWVQEFGIFPNSLDYEDAFQAGIIGLISAIDLFDENRNTKFSTYASRSIKNSILRYYLISYNKRMKYRTISLQDGYIYSKGDEELRLEDLVADKSVNIEDYIVEKEEFENFINIILNYMEPREIYILFYKINNYTLMEIANNLDKSHQRIGYILLKIKDKIKFFLGRNLEYTKIFTLRKDLYEFEFLLKKDMDLDLIKEELMKVKFNKIIPSFQIEGKKLIIRLPQNLKSLCLMADIILKMDEIGVKYKRKI